MQLFSKNQIQEFVRDRKIFDPNHKLEITDVLTETDETEGLVNQIFQIRDTVTGKSLVAKQVLPYAIAIERETGEHHYMNPERILSEARALTFLDKFWPGSAPVIDSIDREQGIIMMEDLSRYHNLRFELPKAHIYPNIGIEIGTLLAGLRYYTSDLYLSDLECLLLRYYFVNDYHRERMADMVMGEDNITLRPERFQPENSEICNRIGSNQKIQERIKALRDELVYSPNCFCHMDLHIGNILVLDDDIKLIDSEFSGYGCSYMDLGRIASSFLIDYFSWLARDLDENDENIRSKMLDYNIQIVYDLFESYRLTLKSLVPEKYEEIYQEEAKKSIQLMMLSVLLRMQSGIALSFDLSLISNLKKRAAIEKKAFELAERVLTEESLSTNIGDFLDELREGENETFN